MPKSNLLKINTLSAKGVEGHTLFCFSVIVGELTGTGPVSSVSSGTGPVSQ